MASIEIGPLSHHLDDEEIVAIEQALEDAEVELELDDDADSTLLEAKIDEDILADFFDQLDANEAACDIYMPGEFEEVVEVGEYRIGSAHALLLVLEEIRDELFEDSDEDEDEEPGDFEDEGPDQAFGRGGGESVHELKDEHLRVLWKSMFKGARSCIREGTCLFVHR
jgi:hypothetical protein